MAEHAGIVLLDTGLAIAQLTRSITDPHAPALGRWDVGGLAGHLLRAFRTPVAYLAAPPAPTVDLADAVDYFLAYRTRRTRDPSGTDASVASRGTAELTGADGAAIVAAYEETLDRLRAALDRADRTHIVASPFGGIAVEDYLVTRIFEATVHGLDLARALGSHDWRPPRDALAITLRLLSDLALRTDAASPAILALTGRSVSFPTLIE